MATIRMEQITFVHGARGARALGGLSMELTEGIVGLVGPNGAGKTTLLRLLLGALLPQAGKVRIDGLEPRAYRNRHPIGFLPERQAFAPYLTVREFLEGVASVAGPAPGPAILGAIAPIRDQRLGSLSLGQARRVEIAAALCGDPDLLLLDEPTNGLDPLAVGWLRQAVEAARRPGRIVLIASHHLDELQRVVDRIAVLRAGTLVGIWPRTEALSEFGSFDQLFRALHEDVPMASEVS